MLFRVGRTLAVACCVSAAAVELAVAADIPYLRSPPPVDVKASWAGFYLGGQIGYGSDSVRWRNLGASGFFSPLNSLTRSGGGVQARRSDLKKSMTNIASEIAIALANK